MSAVNDQRAGSESVDDSAVVSEDLIEEISIDGMCGVY
jgi:mycofactocin precursor